MHYLSLPILNESENLPALFNCLAKQDFQDFSLVACVNNYDSWWDDELKKLQCEDNQKSIELLKEENRFKIVVIDKSSPQKGWKKKKGGVGHARKTSMDFIASTAHDNDLIISIDADTYYPSNYLSEISKAFNNKKLLGLALPYYHPLDGKNDRLILRYEIYMRYFLLNMLRVNNPYAYTALGSAMAFPVWAYKKVGGMTPVMSGEDFYFLQKLRKSGELAIWANTVAYPSPRFSDRVNFGTGPALIKGETGDWDSYPFYSPDLFDKVEQTFNLFPDLFLKDIETPMDSFLRTQFKDINIWKPLRENYKDVYNFVKACTNKVDGLRILQFLKSSAVEKNSPVSQTLSDYLLNYFGEGMDAELKETLQSLDFECSGIDELKLVRDFLYEKEMEQREL